MFTPTRAVARRVTGWAAVTGLRPCPPQQALLPLTSQSLGTLRRKYSQTAEAAVSPPPNSQDRRGQFHLPEDAPQFTHQLPQGEPVTVTWTGRTISLQDTNGQARRILKAATLRDSCACPQCKDASSGQKSFTTTEIPHDVRISHVRATDTGLAIAFSNDIARFAERGHEMTLPWTNVEIALRRRTLEELPIPRRRAVLRRTGVQYWDGAMLSQSVRKIDYEAFMQEDSSSFWDVVIDICRFGIVFIKNVPRDEESVVRITTRIANIRETFYGRTFDVRAKPNAENVAYTSGYLGLHQDLCYLQPPPMIQVLHCMDNSCAGGESLFSDGERVGRLLWPFTQRSRAMAPLADHAVPYQYDRNGYHYYAARTVLDSEGDPSGRDFTGVYWSPPFQGRYLSAAEDLAPLLAPARLFEELINEDKAMFSYKMEEGECVLFDNLRVMHGRTAFNASAGGARWLRGAYIAAEDFLSRASYIPQEQAEKYRGDTPWTSELAHEQLRSSPWYENVLERVRNIDPNVD